MAANVEYLLHHLLTSGARPEQVDELAERAQVVLAMARDLALGFAERFPYYDRMQRYYEGRPPMPRSPERITAKYRELLFAARSNWCGLVVDVVDERLRIGSVRSSANPVKDPTLWKWWQANNMDGASTQIHNTALRLGCCYVSCWPNGDGIPKIMGESPMGCFVDYDLETDEALAAIRIWHNPRTGIVYADLTLPDFQFKLASTEPLKVEQLIEPAHEWMYEGINLENIEWAFREDVEDPVLINAQGEVPYKVMRTMPDLMGGYRSEIEGITPIQDRINRTNFDRLVTQEMAAFPQRWVTGIEIPLDPETGQPREPFNAAIDRVWTASEPDVKFGQFPVAELDNYLAAVTSDTQALATQSRTPPHYLIAGMGQFPSGESVRATEYGLTRKIQSRQQSYGDTWADVLRLAAKVGRKPRLAKDMEVGVVWDNVEARSEGEIVDALLKMATLRVPLPALWQRWGANPAEIESWERLVSQEDTATAAAEQAEAQAQAARQQQADALASEVQQSAF